MKLKLTTQLTIVLMVLLAACSGKKQADSSDQKSTETISEATYRVQPDASTVYWKGEVAGVYGHNGVIAIEEGEITTAKDKIESGKVVIDMTSIQPRDSSSYKDEEGRRAIDLVNHLSTGDFFLVESYPTASFVIKKHEGDKLIGDLTIRGITKEATATLTNFTASPKGLTGTADLVFNRKDFNVSWKHYMKDMVLSDDISVKIELNAKS